MALEAIAPPAGLCYNAPTIPLLLSSFMKYDAALKELLRHCHAAFLRDLLGIPVTSSTLMEERPQETTSVRSSDFLLRVVQEDGEEFLVLIEFQTYWQRNVPQRLLEYRARHVLREGLDAITVVMLLRPSPSATDHYQDREVDYRFRLVKPYELDAAEVLRENRVCLMPLTPLMQGGVDVAVEAERAIVDSDLTEEAKADMLTNMTLMAGLVSKDLARQLLNRRRDLMIQSFGYELIMKEGLEKGLKEGLEQGLKEGFKQGFHEGLEEGLARGREEGMVHGHEKGLVEGLARGREEGREEGREQGYREGLLAAIALGLELKFGMKGLKLMPEIRNIQDLVMLEIIEQAIRTAQSPEELRELYQR